MILLRWNHRRARVWLRETPPWGYEEQGLRRSYAPNVPLEDATSAARAIELYIPSGARAHYGGLSLAFSSAVNDHLVVEIPTCGVGESMYGEALAEQVDTVHIGLPDEYAQAALGGILTSEDIDFLGTGLLRVVGATYGEIGSSPWIFRVLARVCVALLKRREEHSSDQELISIIENELSYRAG